MITENDRNTEILSFQIQFLCRKFLDAGIQDVSTSISIVHDLTEKHKFSKGVMMMMVMKVTNINKHEIVDTRA